MDVPVPQIHEEFMDSAQMTPQERAWCMFEAPEPAESPGVAGGTSDTTSTAATAFDTAIEKSVGEARPPEIAKDWATTVDTAQSLLATGKLGLRSVKLSMQASRGLQISWPRQNPKNPNSQTFLVSFMMELGLFWPRANGTTSASPSAIEKSSVAGRAPGKRKKNRKKEDVVDVSTEVFHYKNSALV